MPAKRRASTSTEDSVSSTTRRNKKAKQVNYNQAAICQELFDTIRNHKLADGRLLCEAMIRVPKRRSAPEYYESIKQPIDLLKIQQKLKTEEYDEIEQLTEDVQLLVKNAKSYYQRSSQEYKDAVELWSLYQSTKSDLIAAAFGESSTNQKPASRVDPIIQAKCQQLLDAFKKLKNGDRLLCEIFMTLPDKKGLPIYYDVIKHPIALDTISKKLDAGKYISIDSLEQDLNLMLKNAMEFNEPGSTVYKDAETLKLMMSAVMSDIMLASPNTAASKSDKRSRRASAVPVTASSADPMDEDTETECEEDGDEEESSMLSLDEDVASGGDPYWLLFKAIATHTDDKGKSTTKPFLKLPNKRWFPDYYDDIANPISMTQIKRKIKRRKYISLNEMAADMNLMFENAKEYNADESKIFQNAIDMQSVMWEKKKQIEAGIKIEVGDEVPTAPSARGTPARRGGQGGSSRGAKPGRGGNAETETVDSVPSSSPSRQARGRGRGRASMPAPSGGGGAEKSLRQRLLAIYHAVYDCEDGEGRLLIGPFIDLPLKSDYPEYYEYITEPIDMTMIEEKIMSDKYESEKELIMDLKLMFNNARSFNEDGSQIYRDASALEKAMKKKVMELSIGGEDNTEDTDSKSFTKEELVELFNTLEAIRTFATSMSPLQEKLNDLYETIKMYKDQHSRVLSTPFFRLPTKQEFPEYYEVIRKPIDLHRIHQKILTGNYDSLESMLLDVTMMFDNAMLFNEPDSVLYKDAAVLLNEFLKRFECLDDQSQYKVPVISDEVQKMLHSLYHSTVNHQDEDGRLYVDSLIEMDEALGKAEKLNIAGLTVNMRNKRYQRLDRLQEDLFSICENARELSRTDSQVYDDSVEIQKHFMIVRDNVCRNGEGLGFSSPAISYTHRHLLKSVEEQTARKRQAEEIPADDTDQKKKALEQGAKEDEVEQNGVKYQAGDFVYITPKEDKGEPHIMNIERIYKDPNGDMWLYGGWFYRPHETFHLASKKFLSKEVFRTDVFDSIPFSAVVGRCYVMYVKDYFKNKPEGFEDNDVYVCESRYSKKTKQFQKIKQYSSAVTLNPDTVISPRAIPLLPTRVPSAFAGKKLDSEGGESKSDKPATIVSLLPNKVSQSVVVKMSDGEPGCTYYEQFVTANNVSYKLGDCVEIRNPPGPPIIARIEKLFKDAAGWLMFIGPSFLRPETIDHTPARLFYHKELLLAAGEDKKYSLANVTSKCAILWFKDYATFRPTEIPEDNIFVCESKYIEGGNENTTRKIAKGFKPPPISSDTCPDEIYYFPKKISLKRMASPLLYKLCAEAYIQEPEEDDSREQSITPAASNYDYSLDSVRNTVSPIAAAAIATPGSASVKKKRKKHHITSFQLFANSVRGEIQRDNKGASFGEISQLIAAKWRSLSDEEQHKFKEQANKLAEESKAREEAEMRAAAARQPPPTQFHKDMFPQPNQQQFGQNQPILPQPDNAQGFPGQQRIVPMQPGMVLAPGQQMPMQHQGFPPQQQGFPPQQQGFPPQQQGFPVSQHNQQWQQAPGAPGVRPIQPQMFPPGTQPNQMPPNSMQQFMPQQNMPGSPMHRPSPVQTPEQSFNQQPQQQPTQMPQQPGMPGFQATPAGVTPQMPGMVAGPAVPPPQPQRPPSPKFISVDMPAAKISHSDVYMRYISGLRGDNPVKVTNWERELIPEQIPPPNPSRVPGHWLAQGAGSHGTVLNALHSLRDLMMQDTMRLKKSYML